VVSTLGAGDVFHGALVAALVRDHTLFDAVCCASVAAALACRSLDGQSAIPSLAELNDHLARYIRQQQ
jgi:sulfofructose kinase